MTEKSAIKVLKARDYEYEKGDYVREKSKIRFFLSSEDPALMIYSSAIGIKLIKYFSPMAEGKLLFQIYYEYIKNQETLGKMIEILERKYG